MRLLYIFFIFMLFQINNSHAGDLNIDQVYKKWVDYFDENLWVIKKYEPKLYSEILDGVYNDLGNGSTKQTLLWNVAKKQDVPLMEYMVAAPLEILDAFHHHEIAKMEYLIKNNKTECLMFFTESASIIDVYKIIPKELKDHQKIFESAIIASKSGFKPNVDIEKGELDYNSIIFSMQEKYGLEFEQAIDKPTTIKSCVFLNEIDEIVSNLDVTKRENVLRYLYLPE